MNREIQSDDERLVASAKGGDCDAFGKLVLRYQDRLFNGMFRMVRCETLAADVVQDAFLLAWRKLDLFAGNSQFYTWLYRIAHNTAVSRLRSRKSPLSLDALGSLGPALFVDGGPAPDANLDRQEDQMLLEQALERLTDDHRAIIILREIEGMDYEQISSVLDLPVGTVRSRLFRARMQLKEELEAVFEDNKPEV